MNIWEILDIDVTDDPTVIMSAYARKLKACHPEDDPDGFQRLREAYEAAIKFAKAKVKFAGAPEAAGASVVIRQRDAQDRTMPASKLDTEKFWRQMQSLYDDFYARIETDNWSKILQTDLLWDMKTKEDLRPVVLRFFMEHPVLPQSVWRLMDTEFGWSDSSTQLPPDCKLAAAILLREIDPKWDMSFSLFHKGENAQIDFSRYAKDRRDFRNAVIEDNDTKARDNFFKAVTIFENDPDIFRFYLDYLNWQFSEGKIMPENEILYFIISKLVELNPKDYSYLLERADMCMNMGFYERAISDYYVLLGIFPDNLEIPFHLSGAYGKIGKTEEQKQYLNYIISEYSQVQERLRHNINRSIDSEAAEKQLEANERVQTRSARSRMNTEIALIGVALIMLVLVLIYIAVHIAAREVSQNVRFTTDTFGDFIYR